MSLSAEMFVVVSLMFAVFAAVAAVGTSIVLGVGFERLRAGFEIVKKQTGFFSDAIHKLDQRTEELDKKSNILQQAVGSMSTRVERVEKQSSFFFESLNSMEEAILKGSPAQAPEISTDMPKAEESEEPTMVAPTIDWSMTSDTARLLKKRHEAPQAMRPDKPISTGLSSVLVSYLMNDNSPNNKNVIFH